MLNDNGSADIRLNTGTPDWSAQGRIAEGAGTAGLGDWIVFADVSGDARDDCPLLTATGAVDAWLTVHAYGLHLVQPCGPLGRPGTGSGRRPSP
ncbi:hypothetical protein [Streptomyces sp. HPF1205]|uniref:hypothetical protein n=1 Tax=Streptomyces sp. HPF1205 TaxID=2873262 RepID=UPI001CED7F2E|nr:hypothetical protein [Streptomyces sp. HPF1205]